MAKIALIGYGRMGRTVRQFAEARGHTITAVVDPLGGGECRKEITAEALADAEVCIDFTTPQTAVENIRCVAMLGKNMVIGTTGWYNRIEDVKRTVAEHKVGLIWSGNFSLGVNALFRIIGCAARMFDRLPEYDVLGHEFHHKGKADSPSGTAAMLGNILLQNIARKRRLVTDKLDRKIEPDEIQFSSTRGGAIPGTHLVLFDSPVDTIEIRHTARGREGFAAGAVTAAEFIRGKKGVYSIDDLMNEVLGPADPPAPSAKKK
ncbi:MAG: 4-hydroxy-tetrahydrodipicolinate reductase [Anaerolineales bacterium]|nr:4-hydroxy-tetrahydrodipicolinate reductase [Anaerolineales bacterium]